MNATPTRSSNKNQRQGAQEYPKQKQDMAQGRARTGKAKGMRSQAMRSPYDITMTARCLCINRPGISENFSQTCAYSSARAVPGRCPPCAFKIAQYFYVKKQSSNPKNIVKAPPGDWAISARCLFQLTDPKTNYHPDAVSF
jgi:hypothetical protein